MKTWHVEIWMRGKLSEQPEEIWVEASNHFTALVRALNQRSVAIHGAWYDVDNMEKVSVTECERSQ